MTLNQYYTANKDDSCGQVMKLFLNSDSDCDRYFLWFSFLLFFIKSRLVAGNSIAFRQYLSVIFWHRIDIKLIKIQPKWDILRTTKFSQAINLILEISQNILLILEFFLFLN